MFVLFRHSFQECAQMIVVKDSYVMSSDLKSMLRDPKLTDPSA